MTSLIDQAQVHVRKLGHMLNDSVAMLVGIIFLPVYAVSQLMLSQPLLVYSFLIPLLSLLIYRHGRLLWLVPPLVALSIPLLLIGLLKSDSLTSVLKTNRPALLIFIAVIGIEMLALINSDFVGSSHFFGRIGFLLIVLAVAANVVRPQTIKISLYALTVGVAVLGILTVLHAFDIFTLPTALAKGPARTFLGIRFPVRRTLGIGMSYGKFGIISSVAMVTLIFSTLSPYRVIKRHAIRLILFIAVSMGVLISQGRGVFLTVGTTSLFAILASLQLRSEVDGHHQPRASRTWLIAFALMAVLIVVVGGFIPNVAESELVDVEVSKSLDNALGRVNLNRHAALLLFQNPVLGLGHGTFRSYTSFSSSIHNHFLEQFVATGLIGGILYIAFYAILLLTAWRTFARSTSLEFRALAGILFAGLIGVALEYQVFPGFLVEAAAWLVGLILALNTFEKTEVKKIS